MSKLYFGGPLDTIKDILQFGFKPGQVLRATLLEAMVDARNSVGLNRRFRPAVIVIDRPSDTGVLNEGSDISVGADFLPMAREVYLIKIDFNTPNLVRVAGTVSPLALFETTTAKKHSPVKRAVR